MWLAYGAADRGRTYSYLQQFHCVLAGNTELDGAADRGGTYSYLNIFITAIFTVSVTEGPTAPGVGAFDSEGRERSNSTRPTVPLIEVVSFRTWPVPLGFSLGLVTLIRSP